VTRFKLFASFIFFALVASRSASAQELVDPDRPALVLFADGGGLVNVRPAVLSDEPSFTKGAGKVGVGLDYRDVTAPAGAIMPRCWSACSISASARPRSPPSFAAAPSPSRR
jgi:hypothetical protein